MSGAPEADRPSLRERLLALRDELRERLADAEIIEQRWLAMLADCEVVITAIDAADLEA